MFLFRDTQRFCRALVLCFTLFFNSMSFADHQTTDNAWKVEVAPYLWAINMNGTVQAGPARAHIDQDFGQILSHLNVAGMLWLDAYKDKYDIFVNLLYSSLTINSNYKSVSSQLRTNFGLFSAGVAYEIYRKYFPAVNSQSYLALNPYIGFRYTLNDAKLTVESPFFNKISVTNNQNWTDPIIGLRLNYIMTKAWSLVLAGDVGGTNAAKDTSYNVLGLLGYTPQSHWTNTTWYVGYRLLDQHYEHGSGLNLYNWNMKIAGPLLGVSIVV